MDTETGTTEFFTEKITGKEKRAFNIQLRTLFLMVGRGGFEPPANGLKVHCSTAELTALLIQNFEARPINNKFIMCQAQTIDYVC